MQTKPILPKSKAKGHPEGLHPSIDPLAMPKGFINPPLAENHKDTDPIPLPPATLPPTLWEYYKLCKASGFMQMLEMMRHVTADKAWQREHATTTKRESELFYALKGTAQLMVPTSTLYSGMWLTQVYAMSTEWALYQLGQPPEPPPYKHIRTKLLRSAYNAIVYRRTTI